MKRYVCIFLAFALLLAFTGCGAPAPEVTTPTTEETEPTETVAPWMTFPADRALTAPQYFVYDCQAGEFVKVSGDTDQKVYPASITKLFTAYVAAQYLAKDKVVTVGDSLSMVVAGSSVAGLKKGDKLTVSCLIEGMMLPSGNDAAYVLAAEAGRVLAGKSASTQNAVSAFVGEMNRQAKLLGMKNSNFANPDGIHKANHYSSFEDLALLGMLTLEDPVILKHAGTATDIMDPSTPPGHYSGSSPSTTVISGSGLLEWKNTNELIHPESQYFCPYAIGLKTGQTPSAGSCLLSAFRYRDKTYIIGVFGCPQPEDRFADTLQLFNEAIGYTPS